MKRWWTLPLLLLAIAVPARAEEPAPSPPPAPGPQPAAAPKALTPEQAADAALAAWKAKDAATLESIASGIEPDPWIVADDLVARGEGDAAAALAKASPRPDTEALPKYVASRRGAPVDLERRKRLARVGEVLRSSSPQDALEVVGPPEKPIPPDVVSVRLASGRAMALEVGPHPEMATAAYLAAGEAAERMGWLLRAWVMYGKAGMSAHRVDAHREAIAAFQRSLALCERRRDADNGAVAKLYLGTALLGAGEPEKALAVLELAVSTLERLGVKPLTASALRNIGAAHGKKGDPAKALASYERALRLLEELGDQAGIVSVLLDQGRAHEQLGDFARAIAGYERAVQIRGSLGDRAGAAEARVRIGRAQQDLADYPSALTSLEGALREFEPWETAPARRGPRA